MPNFQMTPIFSFLISSGSKKKEPKCVYLSEAKTSHSHKIWTEVSSSVPHFLQVGLLINPIILDYTKLRSQNLRCIKIFKRHRIKNHSEMFRIVCDPSSGSIKLYLTEIRSGSLIFVVCLVSVWQRNF